MAGTMATSELIAFNVLLFVQCFCLHVCVVITIAPSLSD